MNTSSPIDRQQAIDYIKARLSRLSERKMELLRTYQGPEGHTANQIKVIDGRVDHLLDALNALQAVHDAPSISRPLVAVTSNFERP